MTSKSAPRPELNKKKYSGKLPPSELDCVGREIAGTDRQIDDLVYDLYALTDKERQIVEEETGGRVMPTAGCPSSRAFRDLGEATQG